MNAVTAGTVSRSQRLMHVFGQHVTKPRVQIGERIQIAARVGGGECKTVFAKLIGRPGEPAHGGERPLDAA